MVLINPGLLTIGRDARSSVVLWEEVLRRLGDLFATENIGLSAVGVKKVALMDGSKSHAFCQTGAISSFDFFIFFKLF